MRTSIRPWFTMHVPYFTMHNAYIRSWYINLHSRSSSNKSLDHFSSISYVTIAIRWIFDLRSNFDTETAVFDDEMIEPCALRRLCYRNWEWQKKIEYKNAHNGNKHFIRKSDEVNKENTCACRCSTFIHLALGSPFLSSLSLSCSAFVVPFENLLLIFFFFSRENNKNAPKTNSNNSTATMNSVEQPLPRRKHNN